MIAHGAYAIDESRSPRAGTHLQGDLIVKDVCGSCNSGPLSNLDAYGKELYERYFASPVYADETVSFDYDGNRLLRWLLKMSYNRATHQNADIRVLSDYRRVMLGESPLSARIGCWLRLVTATWFDPQVATLRPARRHEQGHSNVEEPLWFRIAQFRLPSFPSLFLVQRTVLINSFAFTLLVARADEDWPSTEFDGWVKAFVRGYPEAKPIVPGIGRLTATAADEHAASSIYPLFANYPSRFSDKPNPFVTHALRAVKNGEPIVVLHVPGELIDIGDTAAVASALHHMVSTRENAAAFRQRVGVMVSGFDDDPRGLWQFPKVRQFFRSLFVECPFVMLVAHPDGALLKLLAACTKTRSARKGSSNEYMSSFLVRSMASTA